MQIFVIRIFVWMLLTGCVCLPGLYAQEAASQGWGTVEPKQRSSSAISMAVTEGRYEVARSVSGNFSPNLGQNETAKDFLLPFPILMTKAIVYPRKAIHKGWEGQAVVAAEVLPDGSVGRTALAKSSGYEILDDAAQGFVRTWKFAPEIENDNATSQYVDIPVTFKLQSEDRS